MKCTKGCRLWEGSWESGAQVWDAKNNIAYDPSKIHEVVHHGKYYQMSGIQQTHPSPQRTPVLFQAGGSKSGVEFAGKHAEAIFCMDYSITKLRGVVDQVRASASRNGRDPRSLKVCIPHVYWYWETNELLLVYE